MLNSSLNLSKPPEKLKDTAPAKIIPRITSTLIQDCFPDVFKKFGFCNSIYHAPTMKYRDILVSGDEGISVQVNLDTQATAKINHGIDRI